MELWSPHSHVVQGSGAGGVSVPDTLILYLKQFSLGLMCGGNHIYQY